MDPYYSGFRPLPYSETTLLNVSDNIRVSKVSREITILVQFDFSIDFDFLNILSSLENLKS